MKINVRMNSAASNNGRNSQYDALNATSDSLGLVIAEALGDKSNSSSDEREEEALRVKKSEFEARRRCFKENEKLSLAKVLEKMPDYNDFQKVQICLI